MRKALIVTMVLSFVCLIPTVSASHDSMKVVLLVGNPGDENIYDVGDSVPLELRVFDSGQPTDSDFPPIVTLNKYEPNEREISVLKIGSGIYSGSFTIRESDADDFLHIRAQATLGKENEEDTSYDEDMDSNSIRVSGDWGLDIVLEFDKTGISNILASPGDTVDMTITVTYNGIKVDPDDFDLTADGDSLEYINPTVGIFRASYEVDPTITESESIYISADCEYNGDWHGTGGSIRIDIFHVWYHKVSISNSIAQFELGISDLEGKAISGAKIDFNYEIDDFNVDDDSPSKSGITDSQGKAQFSISHDSAYEIWIEGTIEFSGRIQEFDGYIEIRKTEQTTEIEEPSTSYDFQVIYQENAGIIENGEEVTMEYIAYSNANPLPNQKIYYYIHTDNEFIKSGSTTSNSIAKFTINFRTPDISDSFAVIFESAFEKQYTWEHADCDDGLVYRVYQDYVIIRGSSNIESYWGDPDESISIEITPLKIGGKTTITSTFKSSMNSLAWAFVLPGAYSPENIFGTSTSEPEWSSWTSSFMNLLEQKDDKYTLEIILPEFLPDDITYTVMVIYVDPTDTESPYHWNYIHIKPGEGTESEEGEQNILFMSPMNIGGIGVPWLAIIIIIVLILVIIVVGVRRRMTKRAMTSQGYTAVFEDLTPLRADQRSRKPRYPQGTVIFREEPADYKGYSQPQDYRPPPREYEKQYPRKYPPDSANYEREPSRSEQYPTSYTQRFPQKDAFHEQEYTTGVTCSSCNRRFIAQSREPPFKTVCPYCNQDNIIV
jgi:hypothetical protein